MKLKDNHLFRLIIIPLCIAFCFVGKFIPPFGGLTQDALHVLGIFIGSLILWLTIGIDWPSLLCIFALGFVESVGFKSVLTSSFGNATFIFLLFTFICTYALAKTTFIKRLTLWFINLKIAKKNGLLFSFLFLFSVLLVGLFISPSVLFVVILPILKEIFKIAEIEKGEKIGKSLLMGLGFTVSISSGMTTIAHVFPVIAMENAEIHVGIFEYMLIGIPVGLVLFALMFVLLFIVYKPNTYKLTNINVKEMKSSLPKVKRDEIITLAIFITVVISWIVLDLISSMIPEFKDFYNNKITTAMPPIIATVILCIIRIKGQPIIKVDEAFKNVPWGSLIMCAATLALGAALTSDAVGLKQLIQDEFATSFKTLAPVALLIIFTSWAAIQTNVSSNMVTAKVVATVALMVIGTNQTALNFPVLICLIGMLASFAFATPPSMPHIAIVAGDDYCSTKDVLTFGGILTIIAIVVVLLVGYPLGTLII